MLKNHSKVGGRKRFAMNPCNPNGIAESLKILAKNLFRENLELTSNSHSHPACLRQGDFTGSAKPSLSQLKFGSSFGKICLQILIRCSVSFCLSMAMLPFTWENSEAQIFNYHWNIPGKPKDTFLYVHSDMPASDYPYLAGRLNESHPRRQTRAYLMWVVDNISTSSDWPTTDDVHINAEPIGHNSSEGTSTKVCSGETVYVKEIGRHYGTWYFETRTLHKRSDSETQIPVNNFRFWFCPKKSAFDSLSVGAYYRVYLNARGRHENNGWNNGDHHGDLKVTVVKTVGRRPDLRWRGSDTYIKHIVADGSQSYDDEYGYTVNNGKPTHENVDAISAVQEKWSSTGESDGGTVAELGDLTEELGWDDWGGLDRPLGSNLTYGTWYFANNYQRFMFRPNSAAINTLLPGERVRSHATYKWVHSLCHSCPDGGVISTDVARVEMSRPKIELNWDDRMDWKDNVTGRLEYDSTTPVTSISGNSVVLHRRAGSSMSVSAFDSNSTSDSGMSEVIESTASSETGFKYEIESEYGKWFWKDNDSGFKFEPDWDAINLLGPNKDITTTLEVKISQSGQELHKSSITLELEGVGILMRKLDADSTGSLLKLEFPVLATTTTNHCIKLRVDAGADLVASVHSPATMDGTVPVIKTMNTYEVQMSGTAPTITVTSVSNANGNIEVTLLNSNTDCGGEAVTAAPNQTVLHQFVGPATVSINSVSMAEGSEAGGTMFRFVVQLSSETALTETFTVPVTFAHVTTDDSDFVGTPASDTLDVLFDSTYITKYIDITVDSDTTGEADESFTLTISEPTGNAKDMNLVTLDSSPGANVGIGIITDDDRALVSIDDVSLAEGDGTGGTQFQFTVSLTPATALNQTFTVPVAFKHLTTNSTDFVGGTDPVNLDVNFGATDTSKPINIMVNKDENGEEDESFTLTISEPTGIAKDMGLVTLNTSLGANVGTGIIIDNDFEKISFSWDSGFDGTITFDGISVQPNYVLGRLTNSYAISVDLSDGATEKRNQEIVNSTNSSHYYDAIKDSDYPGFEDRSPSLGLIVEEFRIGSNLTYGDWYRKSSRGCSGDFCADLLFIPNEKDLRLLSADDVITSTHTFIIKNDDRAVIGSRPTTVTIIVDTSDLAVGFEYESRNLEVIESEIASLNVSLNSTMNVPVTIPFTITPGTALLDSDYRAPAGLSVTIPAGETSGTISIPTIHDSYFETDEAFTVSLSDGTGYTVSPSARDATVKIVDNDAPRIRTPGGNACHNVTKPASVATPYIEAYWENGAPTADGEPIVYRKAGDAFDVRIGFRNPTDETPRSHPGNNTFYFAIYYQNGDPENPGIGKEAKNGWGGVGQRISEPRSFRGYLRYRIIPRATTGNDWYGVGDPCEFHIWWTDANKPGITMSIDETVKEGRSLRVTATATPAPNRDIIVPVTLSDVTRIEGPQSFNITIKAGQTSGHMVFPTKFQSGDQTADEVTASAEWRSTYWLDDSKKSATTTIEDHEKKLVTFKNSDPDITVNESGTAELEVEFDGANPSGVVVKYQIENVSTAASDYTAPASTEITIASGTEGTISIPINSDMEFENTESFTVTLIESDDSLPKDRDSVATVTIINVDRPMPVVPNGESCDDVTQPATTTTINTQAYWKLPLPNIYQVTNNEFTVQMGFRDPVTKQTKDILSATLFKIGIYYLSGAPENVSDAIGRTPPALVDHLDFPLASPRDYTGYLRYRIEDSNDTDNKWYDIGTPCEFPIWWTNSTKPGIALSIDKKFVVEGNSFRVTATATPPPNRDLTIPVTISDATRITGSENFNIVIKSGQPTGHMDVQTVFMPGDQTVDDLTVSAEWRSTFWMDESVSSEIISISENAVPIVSISSDYAVTEADEFAATFTVTSDVDLEGEDIELYYTPTETGNFLVAPVPDLATRTNNGHISGHMTSTMLSFADMSAAGDGTGPFEATIAIPLRGNAIPDSEVRTVAVTLNPDAEGTDYWVSAPDSSATVRIIDDETLPVLTFEASNNPVEFDEPASEAGLTFKITASAMPFDAYPDTAGVVEIDVHFTPSQTGSFIKTTNDRITPDSPVKLVFTESNGLVTADLTIPIAADEIEEPSGSVSLTLLAAGTPAYFYKLGTEAEKNTHKVKIYDNDEPELSISVAGDQFVEGSAPHIRFTVTARFTVETPLVVNFSSAEFEPSDPDTVSSQNEFLGSNVSPTTLDFSSSTTQDLNILIADDEVPESSTRHVKVTLLAGADYTVAGVNEGGSANILIVDDDADPSISVSGPLSVIESAGQVQFTVSALVETGEIAVKFNLSDDDSEDYLTDTEEMRNSATLTLMDDDSNGTYTGVITVNLHNDGLADRTGEIELELVASENVYKLGTPSVATVTVYDDDVPELSIAAGEPITETDPPDTATAVFTVESQVVPNEGESDEGRLTVHYGRVSPNFLASDVSGTSTTADLSFSDSNGSGVGPFTADLMVTIESDTEAEADGTIVVTLEEEASAGTSYYVVDSATGKHTASVVVTDDDSLPKLTISGPVDANGNSTGTVESEGAAVFIVTASRNPASDITVAFDPEDVGSASYVAESYSTDYPSQTQMHPTHTLTFSDNGSGTFIAELPVLLESDNVKERTGEIMVTLMNDPAGVDSYKPGSTDSAKTTVWDDDLPELIIEGLGTVSEQQDNAAKFQVTARARPSSGSLRVSFTAADSDQVDSGQFIDSQQLENPQELTFATGRRSATLIVPIVNDEEQEGDGSITVVLTEESLPISTATYAISTVSSESTATVIVKDDDSLPQLSIAVAGSGEVAENDQSGTASFTITATIPSGAPTPESFSFRFTPTQSGNFIDDTSGNFTPDEVEISMFPVAGTGNTFTHTLNVPIDNDSNPEATGSISVEILPANSSNVSYIPDSRNDSASVKIFDDDAPELSISVLPENANVTEDSQTSVSFRVTAKVTLDEMLMVDYLPTETGGPYLQTEGRQTAALDFRGGLTEVDFPVGIGSNAIPNPDSVIAVTLQNETIFQNYSVNSDNSTAKIIVFDDESGPRLSIISPTLPIVESTDGSTANTVTFGIKSSKAASDMEVNYTVAEAGAGDFLAADAEGDKSKTLTFTDANLIQDITLTLDNDNLGEPTGTISVTLMDPDNEGDYRINDPTAEFPITAMVVILDDDAPELSIAAETNIIKSTDQFAAFEISTPVMPKTSLSIKYTPVSTDYLMPGISGVLDDDDPPLVFEDGDGDGIYTAMLNVPIHNDPAVAAGGSITVTLTGDDVANPSYLVAEGSKTATVNINANAGNEVNLPRLSISGPDSVAEYAANLSFTVTATAGVRPESNFRVFFTLSQNGSFLHDVHTKFLNGSNTSLGLDFTGTGGTYTATMNFRLTDDGVGEDDGFIKVTINPINEGAATYLVSEFNEHTVTVYDDDSPVIWITALDANAVASEGQEARFTVKSIVRPSINPLQVSYRIAESDFVADLEQGDQTESLTFVEANGEYTATLKVALVENPNSNVHGLVMATLVQNSPATYMVATDDQIYPNSATILVPAANATPTVVIARTEESVVEGQFVRYTLQIAPAQREPVPVMLQWSQVGDFIFAVYPRSVSIPAGDSVEISVPTLDDNKPEEDGSLTLAVETNGNFQTTGNGRVILADNDGNTPTQNRYSVAENVIRSILLEIPQNGSHTQSRETEQQVSITHVSKSIQEGEPAVFEVLADNIGTDETTVLIGLGQQGDYLIGPMFRSVKIPAGENSVLLSVETENDEVAEEDGQISATIQNGLGYKVGAQNTAYVTVSDDLDRMHRQNQVTSVMQTVLPDLLAHSTTRTLDIATERVTQAFSGNTATSIDLNGKSPVLSMLQTGGEMLNTGDADWQSLIDDSSFSIALYPEGGEISSASVWGVGDRQNLSGEGVAGQPSWKGESLTGHFGFDAQVGNSMLAGMSLSVSQSEIDYGQDGSSGMSFDTNTTGIHPYLGFNFPDDKSRVQFMTGYGVNELVLNQAAYSPEYLSGSYHTVGFSGNRRVYSNSYGAGHNLELSVAGEAWKSSQFLTAGEGLIDDLQLSVRHARIAIEGVHDYSLSGGGMLNPSISIGLREDGRNDESVFGLDLSSGIGYDATDGLEVLAAGKSLLYGLNRVYWWKIENSVNFDSGNDGRGVLFKMSRSWSGTDANTDRYIWGSELVDASNSSIDSSNRSIFSTEIGYGLDVLGGSALMTPYSAFHQTDINGSEFHVGSRFATISGIEFELETGRNFSESSAVAHDYNLKGNINW